ncbi:unnamed protein product [Peronospora belbahrii]|uniref:C3H1-type domain-containing protein n=1 Tax=Peronospora belbahrii TaxID=622444 RepID=A0AAU9KT46_9STRA|nr:unnamed protein product [Peronospora belbahrii]CAH0515480.1 unnamed protein product [Peronospora belbahrii]
MGGHEHHREGHKSSRSGAWEGFDKLKKALEGLATAKGVSQSRIGAVAKLAAHYSKFYKHVVHDIEVFVWKAEIEHRLAGLYAIDAIIRQSHAKNDPKDAYVKRFFIRMSDTIAAVKKVPNQFQPKVRHVIDEWQKRGIYTSKQIEDVGGREYLSQGQDENVTPRASSGKLASLLSIIKQKKEEQGYSGEHPGQQGRLPYEELYNGDKGVRDDAGAYNHRSYDEQQPDSLQYDRRDAGGIMGDAPGVPVGSGRIRRGPDDLLSDLDDRDPKKARNSRWGPPKMDNSSTNDRPTPLITGLDREGDYHPGSGRYGGGSPPCPAPLMQSLHGALPRHEEWNRNVPSSHGLGPQWPRSEGIRSPQSGSVGRLNAPHFDQSPMHRPPFPVPDDRRSPGNRIPGTSGEICRNFLAGRCTFGDRCWHIHDPQSQLGIRTEMADTKRKTVLCNNYPLGNCRFGDNCSFAHGEDERGQATRLQRLPMQADQAGSRWQAPLNPRAGMEPSPQVHLTLSAGAAISIPQTRLYGAPQAVYNEPNGDRGIRRDDSSVSFANAAAPSPGGRRLPPDHQSDLMPSTQGYPGAYAAASSTFMTQGPSYSSGGDQGRSHVPESAPVSLYPASGSQTFLATTPTPTAKVLVDDDDADTAEPEFTLEYDDDD